MVESAPSPRRRFGRWAYALAILGFLAYVAWMLGPYLRSIVVRDAAVTSWLNVATSPIDGRLEIKPQSVDGVVGSDGLIVVVRNDILSRKSLTEAQIRVDHASARVKEFRAFLDEIIQLDKDRAELKSHYADAFRAELDEKISGMGREIKVTRRRLTLIKQIASRHDTLLAKGHASHATRSGERMNALVPLHPLVGLGLVDGLGDLPGDGGQEVQLPLGEDPAHLLVGFQV